MDSPPPDIIERMFARFDDVMEFRSALSSESDRGCALFAASYLDAELEALLRRRLVDEATVVETVLRVDGPVGTFSARIDMAFLLGLIGAVTRRDLHLIRKIRNDFGHSARAISFSEPAVASRCRELEFVTRSDDPPPRSRFTSAVLGVAAMIHSALHNATHIDKEADLSADERAASFELGKAVRDAIIKAKGDG